VASTTEGPAPAGRPRVHPAIDWLGVTAWRLIGIGIVFVASLWLLARLWVIVVAAATILGFALVVAGIVGALVPAVAAEFEDLGPTIEQSIDDVEDWVVEDSPFDVSRRDVREFRDQADDRLSDALSSSSGQVVSRTMVVFEFVTALVLALITSFFILKDGGRFGQWTLTLLPERRRALVSRLANRAWRTLGGYLRGSATLGVVEGAIIGLTVWIVGGHLAVPVAVVTFFAAFIPFAGAIVAGAIAVLVTLVTAGFGPAVAVAVVALLVQQLDNDLLAPIVFGRSLELHPLIVLFSLAGGSALMGPVGAVFAVPISAVVINVIAEARASSLDDAEAGNALERVDEPQPAVDPPPA
jgi:predicted PurR-regulated permease PerM